MPVRHRTQRPAGTVVLGLVVLAAVLAGLAGLAGLGGLAGRPHEHGRDAGGTPAAPRPPVGSPPDPTSAAEGGTTPRRPAPVAVRIPAIDVAAPLVELGLNPDGTLEVPDDFAVAGWYVHRAVPGEPGPAIVAGHVDSETGPAVFYRLGELGPGATVDVERTDGSVATFVVVAVEVHDKDSFPTGRVYGPTASPALRLITCGGPFDRSSGHYEDNVIVFATLRSITRR